MDEPYSFRHSLDPDLFALDRLDHLLQTAPFGKAHASRSRIRTSCLGAAAKRG